MSILTKLDLILITLYFIQVEALISDFKPYLNSAYLIQKNKKKLTSIFYLLYKFV